MSCSPVLEEDLRGLTRLAGPLMPPGRSRPGVEYRRLEVMHEAQHEELAFGPRLCRHLEVRVEEQVRILGEAPQGARTESEDLLAALLDAIISDFVISCR